MGLLEQVFGRAGDEAVAAALAHWGLSVSRGEAPTADVFAVSQSLLRLLGERELAAKTNDLRP